MFHNSGQFRYNKYHGEGELHYPDASIYKGEFDRGQRYGHGTYTQPGGCSYEGQWMHDLKDGRGKMEYVNGDVYDGTWVNDVVSWWKSYLSIQNAYTIIFFYLYVSCSHTK